MRTAVHGMLLEGSRHLALHTGPASSIESSSTCEPLHVQSRCSDAQLDTGGSRASYVTEPSVEEAGEGEPCSDEGTSAQLQACGLPPIHPGAAAASVANVHLALKVDDNASPFASYGDKTDAAHDPGETLTAQPQAAPTAMYSKAVLALVCQALYVVARALCVIVAAATADQGHSHDPAWRALLGCDAAALACLFVALLTQHAVLFDSPSTFVLDEVTHMAKHGVRRPRGHFLRSCFDTRVAGSTRFTAKPAQLVSATQSADSCSIHLEDDEPCSKEFRARGDLSHSIWTHLGLGLQSLMCACQVLLLLLRFQRPEAAILRDLCLIMSWLYAIGAVVCVPAAGGRTASHAASYAPSSGVHYLVAVEVFFALDAVSQVAFRWALWLSSDPFAPLSGTALALLIVNAVTVALTLAALAAVLRSMRAAQHAIECTGCGRRGGGGCSQCAFATRLRLAVSSRSISLAEMGDAGSAGRARGCADAAVAALASVWALMQPQTGLVCRSGALAAALTYRQPISALVGTLRAGSEDGGAWRCLQPLCLEFLAQLQEVCNEGSCANNSAFQPPSSPQLHRRLQSSTEARPDRLHLPASKESKDQQPCAPWSPKHDPLPYNLSRSSELFLFDEVEPDSVRSEISFTQTRCPGLISLSDLHNFESDSPGESFTAPESITEAGTFSLSFRREARWGETGSARSATHARAFFTSSPAPGADSPGLTSEDSCISLCFVPPSALDGSLGADGQTPKLAVRNLGKKRH